MTGLVVVADVGGSKLLLRACDAEGGVRAEARHETGPDTDGARLDALVGAFVEAHPDASAVAVAVPGLVDDGRVLVSDVLPRLAGWSPAPTAVGPAAVVVNDVRAALAGVRHREPLLQDVVVVVSGTGIAASVLTGGRVLAGSSGWAGELGSVPTSLTGGGGPVLDEVASGRSIERTLGRRGPEVARLLAAGDPRAVRVVTSAGTALGRAVGMLVTLLNPERVVLGGGATRYAGYADAVVAAAGEAALPEAWERCRLDVDDDPGSMVVRGLAALAAFAPLATEGSAHGLPTVPTTSRSRS